jgi:prepilin-type N-terminal cleavage/methylation domain-containing protein
MKSAFTLMELMVSIVLIVLITLFLYSAIGSMKISNKTLASHDAQEDNRSKIFDLMYRDMIESIALNVLPTKDKHFNVLELQTHNSLHQIVMPYVTYFVHAQTENLIRLESAKKITLPTSYDDRFAIHADLISNKVTDFNVYSKNNELNASTENNETDSLNIDVSRSVLLFMQTKTLKEALLYELAI